MGIYINDLYDLKLNSNASVTGGIDMRFIKQTWLQHYRFANSYEKIADVFHCIYLKFYDFLK